MLTDAEISVFLQQYILPFCRIGMMLMIMPVVSSRIVQARIRLAIAALVTFISVPLLPPIPPLSLISVQFAVLIAQELAIGMFVGFSFQVVFQVFILSGQFIAMKMGLGFASMNDPTNGVQTTMLSQFFLMITTLVFVAINGHLIMIHLIVESFQTLPPGQLSIMPKSFMRLAEMGQWMFASALLFSLPVMTSLLFINIAFGVMSRAAPQLNIFAVGFPFTLVCGLLLIWVGLSTYMESFNKVIEQGFNFVKHFLLL